MLSKSMTKYSQKILARNLTSFGLAENEAELYLCALAMGPSSILNLARASSLKRSTVYALVETLKKKGLMRIDMRGFKSAVVAEPPQHLEQMLEERQRLLKATIPELEKIVGLSGSEGFLRYHQGIEGIKGVYQQLLKDVRVGEDYLVISNPQYLMNLAPDFFERFFEKRARLPIRIRLLLQDGPMARKFKESERRFNQQVSILPTSTNLKTNLIIIPKRVVIHQLTPPDLAIVIENPSVVQLHQQLFEIIWKTSNI